MKNYIKIFGKPKERKKEELSSLQQNNSDKRLIGNMDNILKICEKVKINYFHIFIEKTYKY